MQQPGARVHERVPPRLPLEPPLELRPLGRVGVALEGGQEGLGGLGDVGGVQRADDEGGESGGRRLSAVAVAIAVAVVKEKGQGHDGAEGGVVEA